MQLIFNSYKFFVGGDTHHKIKHTKRADINEILFNNFDFILSGLYRDLLYDIQYNLSLHLLILGKVVRLQLI